MSKVEKSQGLTCPNCSGVVPVPEGARLVQCPFCDERSLVAGERGIHRWQVAHTINRDQATATLKRFFSGFKKAPSLKRQAEVKELFLVYFPYWRVTAFVAGWMFGREKSGDKSTRPVEVEVMEEMHWNDAAADVSEFGVHQVTLSKKDLQPYDTVLLHSQAMVFEPTESRSEALDEAARHFAYRGRRKRSLKTIFYDKFHAIKAQLSIVYYPLWVARYQFRQRNYQVVIDGVKGKVLYGKAPGNIMYRAFALVAGMAVGNFLLVNGTAIAGLILGNIGGGDEESLALICIPAVVGLGLIVAGYRAFRFGEEVEELQKGAAKAALSDSDDPSNHPLKTGMRLLEELSELVE